MRAEHEEGANASVTSGLGGAANRVRLMCRHTYILFAGGSRQQVCACRAHAQTCHAGRSMNPARSVEPAALNSARKAQVQTLLLKLHKRTYIVSDKTRHPTPPHRPARSPRNKHQRQNQDANLGLGFFQRAASSLDV